MPLDQFSYGALTPILSYGISVLGCLFGLIGTARARRIVDGRRKAGWLILSACSIGGTGIWSMHFMAMLGFSVAGEPPIRFDLGITVASLMTAIVVVAIGLFIVGYGQPSAMKVIAAGVFTGIGVAGMHYSGMAAMQIPATVTYDPRTVAASVAIAIVAATVALWFTVTLRRGAALTIGALIMGVAVNGMHFTGMYALRVTNYVPKAVGGIMPSVLLIPIVVFVIGVIFMLLVAMLTRAGVADSADEETLRIHTTRVAPQSFDPYPQENAPDGQRARALRTSAAAFSRRR
jgi:NO-binding membrane sensor protein with MHYT domain